MKTLSTKEASFETSNYHLKVDDSRLREVERNLDTDRKIFEINFFVFNSVILLYEC